MALQLLIEDALIGKQIVQDIAIVRLCDLRVMASSAPPVLGLPDDTRALLDVFSGVSAPAALPRAYDAAAPHGDVALAGVRYSLSRADGASIYGYTAAGDGFVALRTGASLVVATYTAQHARAATIEILEEFAAYLRESGR